MTAAELFVRCLEMEGVEYLFGVPGEENIAVMEALLDSPIKFVTTRHEQGAAFMADVYGRLTGRAGVCMATLGPGATNLITGVADANMDRAPVVAIAGQGATTRLHKESHQILDLVNLFQPITKYAAHIGEPEITPEIVRKAFKVAQTEKPGACFIEFPENIASASAEGLAPIKPQSPHTPAPSEPKLAEAVALLNGAKSPLILAGNGVIRAGAQAALARFAEVLQLPVVTTFMAKGAIASSNPLCLGTVGMKARDHVAKAFERADTVLCVGYDIVEYHPEQWNQDKSKTIIHIDGLPAEVDQCYSVTTGVLGDIGQTLKTLAVRANPARPHEFACVRDAMTQDMAEHATDDAFPVKPQRIVADLRHALDDADIVISDVGAHKLWMARMYPAEQSNTCIISNGFASMGIALPGAIAAKLAFPERNVVAVTGDAGFLMNSQELETALRMETPLVVLIWNDAEYGLITWHQLRHYGRSSHVQFNNPDFIQYAESFGAKGYRVEQADELLPTLTDALTQPTVSIIDCPVDYSENMKLTERLSALAAREALEVLA